MGESPRTIEIENPIEFDTRSPIACNATDWRAEGRARISALMGGDDGSPEEPGLVNVIIQVDSRRLVLALDMPDAAFLGAALTAIAMADNLRLLRAREEAAAWRETMRHEEEGEGEDAAPAAVAAP